MNEDYNNPNPTYYQDLIYFDLINGSKPILLEPINGNDDDSSCLSRCNSNIKCVFAYNLNGNCSLYDEMLSNYLIKCSSSKKSKLYQKLNLIK